MHDTALEIGKIFFEKYITKVNASILDVGSCSVNGSLRSVAPSNSTYIGIDIEKGEGVDIVLQDPYSFPFPDNHFDGIVCTSVFEHDSFFWQTFLELLRVVNHGGFIYINTPSNGVYHAYPQDCWRFYPDAALSLKSWAEKTGATLTLVESFIGKRKTDLWNDCVMVFRKGVHPFSEYKFIHTDFPSYNIRKYGCEELINEVYETEDRLIIQAIQKELSEQVLLTSEQDLRRHNAEQGIQALREILESEKQRFEDEKRGFKVTALAMKKEAIEDQKNLEKKQSELEKQFENQLQQQAAHFSAHQKLDAELKLAQIQKHRFEMTELALRIETQRVKQFELRDQAMDQARNQAEHLEKIAQNRRREKQRALAHELHQVQIREAVLEKERLRASFRERLSASIAQKAQLELQNQNLTAQIMKGREEVAQLKSVVDSAEQWQRRSWAKRAFHIWRKGSGGKRISNGTAHEQIASPVLSKSLLQDTYPDLAVENGPVLTPLRPPALFNGEWYLNTHPDVEEAKLYPYQHYLESGWKEGRNPNPLFDIHWYLKTYEDVRDAGLEPLHHYLESGWKERRNPHPLFNVNWYLNTYSDVLEAGLEPLQHFIEKGWRERRNPNPLFDTNWYLLTYSHVKKLDINPLEYYSEGGFKEGDFPSPLFDSSWYLKAYLDINAAKLNPLQHFMENGWREGRNPNPLFDTNWYLGSYRDVKADEINPLQHFVESGWKEGKRPVPLFDTAAYLERYPDVSEMQLNPLAHYIHNGRVEGRIPHPLFDSGWYTATYPDVKISGCDPFEHYITLGWIEGRSPNSLFNSKWYLDTYSDIKEFGMEPLWHYVNYGWKEGRNPNPLFDTLWYQDAYKDVAAAKINPLHHFIYRGWKEGCNPNPVFDTIWYLGSYKNVKNAKVNPLQHYMESGAAEGLNPGPTFDTGWYLDTYLDVKRSGFNPLEHYLLYGYREGRDTRAAKGILPTSPRTAVRANVAKTLTWNNAAATVQNLVLGKVGDDRLRIILLSHGPPPLQGFKVEGGGLRSWGLAKTIKSLIPEADVTLHYGISSASVSPDFIDSGVRVICCDQEELLKLLSSIDVIIVSYCGYLTGAVLDRILPHQLLILDCYVPIYVEVAARDSTDVNYEYDQYIQQVPMWNRALLRGDYFLYANENQRDFYTGVLSSLAVINPKTYKTTQLLHIPYGIDETEPVSTKTPVTAVLYNKKAKRILWFGGVYPWFDLRTLIDAVKIISESIAVELVVVGARNPFNTHPDFVRSASEVIAHGSSPELRNLVHFEDWVDYNDRADWYLDCDIIVSLSKMGIENRYSWRTRTVDFIWSGALLALNEGDPVADRLFSEQAAVKLVSLEKNELARTLLEILQNPSKADTIKDNLRRIRDEFTWPTLVAPLVATLRKRFPNRSVSV